MAALFSGLKIPFSEFWRMYLDAHRRPATRLAHYLATAFGIIATLEAIDESQVGYMLGGIAISYLIAILSHRWIEGNRPLIRINPFYGMIADMRMCWLAATGRLGAEYRRLGLGNPAPVEPALAKPL